MCLNINEYECIAKCSINCCLDKPNKYKSNCLKKLKTYNNCENCKIYVCEECSIELTKNNINYCLVCRIDEQNFTTQKIKNKTSIIDCYDLKNKIKDKCNNVINKCYNCKEIILYMKSESNICYNICFFTVLIFVPIIVSLIFNILLNGIDSVKDIFISNDIKFIITILILIY